MVSVALLYSCFIPPTLIPATPDAAREARADDALAHREQGETVWQLASISTEPIEARS